jgi:hypothetical protein
MSAISGGITQNPQCAGCAECLSQEGPLRGGSAAKLFTTTAFP